MKVRWSIGYFGVKDIFTLINLAGGVFGLWFAMKGRFEDAGYAIMAGYLFGDALDGPIARATKTGNVFGAEFDKLTDHFAQTIVPGVVLYQAYAAGGRGTLGLALLFILVVMASLRHNRMARTPFDFRACYFGVNRTVSGLAAVALPNAELFFHRQPWRFEMGAVVIAFMAVMNLVPVPYMGHRGTRKMQPYVKALAVLFLCAPVVLFFYARVYVFDFIFVCVFVYALTAWIPVLPDERRAFYDEYRRWSARIAGK